MNFGQITEQGFITSAKWILVPLSMRKSVQKRDEVDLNGLGAGARH